MSTEELEASPKLDMEKFLMADPPPSDIESEEYYAMHVCSFTGTLATLRKADRTTIRALMVLVSSPMVSTFDRSENPWLNDILRKLEASKLVKEVDGEQYPWHRYQVTEKGLALIAEHQAAQDRKQSSPAAPGTAE